MLVLDLRGFILANADSRIGKLL